MTGRNAPCPCGSGRKYKKCCLGAKSSRRTAEYTSADRTRGLALLQQQLERPRWRAYMQRVFNEVLEDRQAVFDVPSLDEYTRNSLFDAIVDWGCFDDADESGATPVAELLARKSVPLGAARFLRAMTASYLRPLEVIGVQPGQTITFKDLADERETTVRERTASKTVMPGQIVYARLAAGTTDLPEIERGMLPVPLTAAAATRSACDVWRADPRSITVRSADLGMELLDIWIDGTLSNWVPSITVGDGEPLMFVETVFDMLAPDRVAPALDRLEGLSSNGSDSWGWAPAGEAPTFIRIEGERLVMETVSAARGGVARAMLEAALGSAVRHRSTTHQHPAQAIAGSPERPPSALEIPPEIERQIVAEQVHQHYASWLDEPIPALDGATPRVAAAKPALRSKLEGLLRGLDHLYLRALKDKPNTAYEPSWIWDELGLRRHGHQAPDTPGLLGHEVVAEAIDGFQQVVDAMVSRRRAEPGFDDATVIEAPYVATDLGAKALMRDADEAHLAAHLVSAVNHRLHGAKTFHIDERLALLLSHTTLSVSGDQIELPITSVAFVLRDRPTLALMEQLLATDTACALRGVFLQTLTVYVHRIPAEPDAGLWFGLMCDAADGRLPHLAERTLRVGPSEPVGVALARLAEQSLQDVLRLVMNAILYANGTRERWTVERRSLADAEPLDVVCLSEALELDVLRGCQRLGLSPSGEQRLQRFLVPGRWRRANTNWKDQRARWIKPEWIGPDIAQVIAALTRDP